MRLLPLTKYEPGNDVLVNPRRITAIKEFPASHDNGIEEGRRTLISFDGDSVMVRESQAEIEEAIKEWEAEQL